MPKFVKMNNYQANQIKKCLKSGYNPFTCKMVYYINKLPYITKYECPSPSRRLILSMDRINQGIPKKRGYPNRCEIN